MDGGAWWAAVHGVAKSRTQLSDFPFTFHFHALEKEMATHSSVLAWRIPRTGEPGGLPSMGSHRIRHWRDLAAAAVSPNPSPKGFLTLCRSVTWVSLLPHWEPRLLEMVILAPLVLQLIQDAFKMTAFTPWQWQMYKRTIQLWRAVPPTPQSCTRLKSCTYIFEVKYFAQTFLKLVFSFFFPSYYEHGIHLKLYNWIHYCALLSVLNIFALPIVVDLIFDYLEE